MSLLSQVISFFRCYMNEREEFEAMAHILWDRELEELLSFLFWGPRNGRSLGPSPL